MDKRLTDAGVNFPDYWDEIKVLKALTTMDTYELYAYFGCSNSTSFTRLMKPCFPNRPDRTSYSKYVRDIVCVCEIVSEDEIVLDPKVEQRRALNLKFQGINGAGFFEKQKLLKTLTEEEKQKYLAFEQQMKAEEDYNIGE